MTQFILTLETEHESSIIEKIEYFDTSNIMHVYFKSDGSIYEYHNISKEMINKIMNAPSLGSFLKKEVFAETVKYPAYKMR